MTERLRPVLLLALFTVPCLFSPLSSPALRAEEQTSQDISPWSRYLNEYSSYFRSRYGPAVKSRYDLFLKETERRRAADPQAATPPGAARRTLDRWVDGIIFEARHLPGLLGMPLEDIRVLVWSDDRWQVMPYQIDEVTADGMKVLPEGPRHNAEKGNSILDGQDEIVLMAHDLGDRVPAAAWPEGVSKGHEAEVTDPVTGKKGWFYVFAYENRGAGLPDRSPIWYRGAMVPLDTVTGYLAFSPCYLVCGKTLEYQGNKYNQIFYHALYQSVLAGGTATDFVDRLKWRLRVRFLFGTVALNFDEDSLTGAFFAWRSGPVRGTYRVWAVANLPLGLKSPRIIADVIQVGENIISTTTSLNVPLNPGYVVTEMTTRIGTDLNGTAEGMKFYNSNNLSGASINGRADPAETTLNSQKDSWRLIYGPQACLMNRSYWSPEFVRQAKSIKVVMVDDVSKEDPPEYHQGQFGAVYSEAVVGNLKPGRYDIGIEWYFLNDFCRPEGPRFDVIDHYLRYQDAPLVLTIEGKTFPNKSMPTLGTTR